MEFNQGDIVAIACTNSLTFALVKKETLVSLQYYSLHNSHDWKTSSTINSSYAAQCIKNKSKLTCSHINSVNRYNQIRVIKITRDLLPNTDLQNNYDELIKLL